MTSSSTNHLALISLAFAQIFLRPIGHSRRSRRGSRRHCSKYDCKRPISEASFGLMTPDTKRLLYAVMFIAGACVPWRANATPLVELSDNEEFSRGPYLAYMSPWNKGNLVINKDYAESITLDPTTFPNGTKIKWDWPAKPAEGIYNFLAIDFGNENETIVQKPIPPRRVKDLKDLSQEFELTATGLLNGFDVISEFYLTQKPGSFENKLFEIEVFLHTPAYSYQYVSGSTPIGNYSGSGIDWFVSIDHGAPNGPDILFMPSDRRDVLSGHLDFKSMLDWLVNKKVISGNEYFNGMAVGVEVRQGGGSLSYEKLEIIYK